MIRNIKALGLAFVAVAAMSMAAASAAQASELHITNLSAQTGVITGHQHQLNKFQITSLNGGPSVECQQATLEATVTDQGAHATQLTSQEGTLTATYSGDQTQVPPKICSAFGQAASVRMNGCNYTLTNKLGVQTVALRATIDIVNCTAGKKIEVQTGVCQITVGEQGPLSHIGFANLGGVPEQVTAQATVSGITYELHGALCGHDVTKLTHDGTYHGSFTLQGYAHGGTEQKNEHGHIVTKYKHNGQGLGLFAT